MMRMTDAPIPLHVPAGVRRTFVCGSLALWIGSEWVWELFSNQGSWGSIAEWAFGVAGILSVLLVLRFWEIRIRRKYLPEVGWGSRCFRASIVACVLGAGIVRLETQYGLFIPGAYEARREGWLMVNYLYEGEYRQLEMKYNELLKSKGGLHVGVYEPKVLCFHSWKDRNRPGWSIRQGSRTIIRDDGLLKLQWNGEGLLEMLQDVSGAKLVDRDRQSFVDKLDVASRDWSAGKMFEPDVFWFRCYDSSYNHRPGWMSLALGGLVIGILGITISISARLTMGRSA